MDNKTLAIIALVLAFLFPIAGLILGIVALVKIKNSVDKNGKGFALAAVIISGVAFIFSLFLIISVIGSLAYFGVLSPATMLPEKCTFPVGITCIDFAATQTSISLILQNGEGRDMKISSVEFTGDAVNGDCKASVNMEVANGGKVEVKATGCKLDSGDLEKARIGVVVNYAWVDSLTLERTMQGVLLTTIGK